VGSENRWGIAAEHGLRKGWSLWLLILQRWKSCSSVRSRRRSSFTTVSDEIPIMLVDEATELDESSWTEIMARHGRDPVTGDEK
jgi:hypothetical protein